MNNIQTKLCEVLNTTTSPLMRWITERTLESDQVPEFYLSEIIENGGKTGGIGELIYYPDTHTFFDTYYDDIQYVLKGILANGGGLYFENDLKTEFSWVAVKCFAYQLCFITGILSEEEFTKT